MPYAIKFVSSLVHRFKARRGLMLALGMVMAGTLNACNYDGKERVGNLNLSAAALNDYQETYVNDGNNKAFAVSPDGAYAAAHSFPSTDLAVASALLNCNARVQPGQLECLVFDINGTVVARTPFLLRRL